MLSYIRDVRDRRFHYGVWDCFLFAAEWVRMQTGRDIAERWRGQYDCADSAARFVADYGSLDGLLESVMRPGAGQLVGVVEIPGQEHACAIPVGPTRASWAALAPGGVAIFRLASVGGRMVAGFDECRR